MKKKKNYFFLYIKGFCLTTLFDFKSLLTAVYMYLRLYNNYADDDDYDDGKMKE